MTLVEDQFAREVRHYQKDFGLENWTVSVRFLPQVELRNAKTLADPRYYTAVMDIYPHCLSDRTLWEAVIIHELIHVVMSLYDFFADNMATLKQDQIDELCFIAREGATSQLTSILMRVMQPQKQ